MRIVKMCVGLALAGALALAASGCGSSCPVHRALFGGGKAAQVPGPQTMCPVMDAKIDKKLFVDHDGKRLYVCCSDCLPKVRQDPAKYVKQLEDAGVVLDTVPAAQP